MEFVDGVNLRHLLVAGRLSPCEALAIVPPLCDALQYVHDRGMLHCDIKPESIFVDRVWRVKIADFGLVRLTGADDEAPRANIAVRLGISEPALRAEVAQTVTDPVEIDTELRYLIAAVRSA